MGGDGQRQTHDWKGQKNEAALRNTDNGADDSQNLVRSDRFHLVRRKCCYLIIDPGCRLSTEAGPGVGAVT